MFTLKDIEMLQVPQDTKMIIIREVAGEEMDLDIKTEIAKQIKKATKLPVVFIPYGVGVRASKEDFSHDWD